MSNIGDQLDNVMPQEAIRRRTELYQTVVDEAVEGRVELEDFLNKLRFAGASASEATDYGLQYAQHMEVGAGSAAQPCSDAQHPEHEVTPEGLDKAEQEAFREH